VPKYQVDKSHADGYKWVPMEAINFSISADHRILDGATVARFGTRMKQLIENPNLMLLNMHWCKIEYEVLLKLFKLEKLKIIRLQTLYPKY